MTHDPATLPKVVVATFELPAADPDWVDDSGFFYRQSAKKIGLDPLGELTRSPDEE